jgi:hypothetical protein
MSDIFIDILYNVYLNRSCLSQIYRILLSNVSSHDHRLTKLLKESFNCDHQQFPPKSTK